MTPLEEALQREVLPSLTGHAPPSPTMRALFSLPAPLGGLGIRNPSGMSAIHHRTSVQVTEPIVELILNQHHGDDGSQDRLQEALTDQRLAITSAKKLKAEEEKQAHLAIRNQLFPPLLSAVDLAMDDGASSWLPARPLQGHGFALHKGAFTSPCGTAGSRPTCPHIVHAVSHSTAAMLSHAARAGSPSPGTMRFGTSRPHS